jgi:hypothetical protein
MSPGRAKRVGRREHARGTRSALKVVPVSLEKACEFVTEHHRHHRQLKIQKFSVAVTWADNDPPVCTELDRSTAGRVPVAA